jgi:hypothetical protein
MTWGIWLRTLSEGKIRLTFPQVTCPGLHLANSRNVPRFLRKGWLQRGGGVGCLRNSRDQRNKRMVTYHQLILLGVPLRVARIIPTESI